jgi:hypothetical protein
MFMIVAGTLMIILFMVVFSEMYQDNMKDKKAILARDFIYSVQNEFIMAAEATPGYARNFFLPEKLEGFDYEVYINGTILTIDYIDNILILPIPNVTGSIKKGDNAILKSEDKICINC